MGWLRELTRKVYTFLLTAGKLIMPACPIVSSITNTSILLFSPRVLEACKVGAKVGAKFGRRTAANTTHGRGADTNAKDSFDINSPADSRLPTLPESRTKSQCSLSDKLDSRNRELRSLHLHLPQIKRRTYPGCEKNHSHLVISKMDHSSFATKSCTSSDLPNSSELKMTRQRMPSDLPKSSESKVTRQRSSSDLPKSSELEMKRQCTFSERPDQAWCRYGRLYPIMSHSRTKTYPGSSKSSRYYDCNSFSMRGKRLCERGYLPNGVWNGFNVAKSKIQELMLQHPTDYSQCGAAVRGMLEAYGREDEKRSEAVDYKWSDIFRVSPSDLDLSLDGLDKCHEVHPVSTTQKTRYGSLTSACVHHVLDIDLKHLRNRLIR